MKTHEQGPPGGTAKGLPLPAGLRWDLGDLYPSVGAWRQHLEGTAARIAGISRFRGRLGSGADDLLEALDSLFEIRKALARLSSYARLLSDEDLRIAAHQGLRQETEHLEALLGEAAAFYPAEILNIPQDRLHAYLCTSGPLDAYAMYLGEIARRRRHLLPEAQERLLASAEVVTAAVVSVRRILCNAEMPFADLTLSTGERVTLTPTRYTTLRASPVREDRRAVVRAYFGVFGRFEGTLGATLAARVRSALFQAKSRNYASCLEAVLDRDAVPLQVYDDLVEGVHRHLSTLHRLLGIKRRLLGVETLHVSDLYAPVAREETRRFSLEEARDILVQALEPLGPDMTRTVGRAFAEGWIHALPGAGKASGAYSNGSAWEVHPFVLINWTGDQASLQTLAHEIGHAVHSVFSNEHQPYPKAGYSLFVAEVASTLCETLLNRFLLGRAASPAERRSLLLRYAEVRRTTLFRQALFAEYEREIHARVGRGEPLTGEALSALYLERVRAHHGHAAGVCAVDPEIAHEWATIPHFHTPFYVYKYATSLVYASVLAESLLKGEPKAQEACLSLLRAGGSRLPIALLQEAGVDPLSRDPFDRAMADLEGVMDALEALL